VLRGHLRALHDELGETCHLMVLEGNGTRFLDCVECTHVLRVGSRVGMLLPAHCTSGGKTLLAELSAAQLTALYPRELPGAPGGVPVQLNALRRQLASIRRRGYATNFEESDRGIVAAGACVRDSAGRAVAALAVAAPSARCPRSRVPALAAAVVAAAEPPAPRYSQDLRHPFSPARLPHRVSLRHERVAQPIPVLPYSRLPVTNGAAVMHVH
jgi:DNA-binding IclR family transcriptional regulator